MNDWEFLDAHVAGDPGALEALIRRHIDMVYTTARRSSRCTEADAQDITQAVFLLLARKAASIARRGTLVGWLYRATRCCAANLHKHNRRRERLHVEAAMNIDRTRNLPNEVDDLSERLTAAMERLRPRERDAVILHYLIEKSFAETALALGITPEAARKRAERGLTRLRAIFLNQGEAMLPVIALRACRAPETTLHTTLRLAGGAPATPHVAMLARKASAASPMAKGVLAAGVAAAIVGALIVPTFARSTRPRARPAPLAAIAVATASMPATAPALPDIVFAPADPDHPTEAEVKAFLKARLMRLRSLRVNYTVHTEYPSPKDGWPHVPARPADAGPPQILLGAPAGMVAAAMAMQTHFPCCFFFPSGSSDTIKIFARAGDLLAYERTLLKFTPSVPFPEGIHVFHKQMYVLHEGVLDRDFDGQVSSASLTGRFVPTLPPPDIETALFLTGYQPSFGRSPPRTEPTARLLSSEDLDGMAVTFPDAHHIRIARNAGARAPALSDAWTLDRDAGYAPVAYASENRGLTMQMSDFQSAGGLPLPQKVVLRFTLTQAADSVWRIDTLAVQEYHVQDPANTAERYALPPDAQAVAPPPAVPAGVQLTSGLEFFLGAEPLDQASLIHVNQDFGKRKASAGSPSTPASRDVPTFRNAHAAFLQRAKEGNIDLLLIGDDVAQHWSDDPALWKQWGDPARVANFGLDGDTVENTLWRVTNGELDNISPKTIVLCIGNTDAANAGYGGPTGGSHPRPGIASTSFVLGGIQITWQPREDPPPAIAQGIKLVARTIHEKCPAARLIVLTVAPRALAGRAAFAPVRVHGSGAPPAPATLPNDAPRLNPRVTEINELLADINPLDLTDATLNPDGTLATDAYSHPNIPSTTLYTRWSATLLKALQAQP